MQEQQELSIGPMPIADMRFLPWEEIKMCESGQDAVVMGWIRRRPRYSVEKGAERMGVTKGTLSKYLSGKLGMGPDRLVAFERMVGNRSVSQYTAYANGCLLTPRQLSEDEQRAAELAALRAKVAQLEAAA